MKDIIAAQQIQRRSKPSLLSKAQKFRVLPNDSLISDQHVPLRKKKRLLEIIRSVKKPEAGKYPSDFFRPPKNPTGRKNSFGALKTALGMLSRIPKKVFFILLAALFLGCLVLMINFIPEPEPPEDLMVREHSGRTLITDNNNGDEIPLDLTETFAWQSYTVRSGDLVETIARRYGLSIDAIIASNDLRNVRRLRAGEKLRIPNMDGIPYIVKTGDSYSKIASSFNVPLEAILDANDIQDDRIKAGTVLFVPGARMDKNELRRALGELFIWPISGKISSGYGYRNDPFTGTRSFHAALDISANIGTPVKASADGRVSDLGRNSLYGNFLIITHADNYQTMYAHLNRVLVKKGAYVNQGTTIALSGNTGRSTGPHLHFMIYKNTRAINPLEELNKK
ncbi:MAG: M23 family metallopeptidase [Treponema sp.]|jgi:murein DD-endopeptidase MepM/ murein hydrolase activator NlpD|nr:M23 family metallopeptidase [Treponema sp.]